MGPMPENLKTTVGILLRSPVPIVLLWGPDGIMIYNDAYSIFAGGRHPILFGSRVREGWPASGDDFRLEWDESGGPEIDAKPHARGFGSILTERSMTRSSGAESSTTGGEMASG
ncbi:hypothetical protein [Bradyrhizobium japonicum]|uniref:hypothetical protein n=1 Tax=Bradyrhizobium japonicum TaxID=375 RepID=UPI0034E3C673